MAKIRKKFKKFKFVGKSLYFPKEGLLVIADLHIGYEEYLNEQGIFIPRTQFKETLKDLEKVFKKIKKIGKIKEIIILGDLKHEFGQISSQEWREVKRVLDIFKKKAGKVILIKGNHDVVLGPIAERKELKIKDFYIKEGVCFLHGHKLFLDCLGREIKMIAMGHKHPAIFLADKYKKEKYKCFLKGKWKKKDIIILPSFFPFIEGGDIMTLGANYLFIPEKNLGSFEVFVVGDDVYGFGKMKKIV